MPLIAKIIKNYMRYFPINEGKRYLFNDIYRQLGNKKELVETHNGFKMELDPTDDNQRHTFWYARYNEKDEVATVQALLEKGETFIDVGANIGYFTLSAARKVGSSGRILAFEPNTYTYKILKNNIELNNFTQVELLQKAVGNKPDKLTFYMRNSCADAVASLIKSDYHDSSVEVAVTTVDTEVETRGLTPSVLKVDAEGFDETVVKGAQKTLAVKNPPALIVESLGDQSETIYFLKNLGFVPYVLSKHLWSQENLCDKVTSNNTLWIHTTNLPATKERISHLLRR